MTPWISLAKEIVGEQHFDQVWINDLLWINDLVISPGRGGDISEAQLAMLATLAPVRVGLLTESVYDYTDQEMAVHPDLQRRQAVVEKFLPYLTHVVAYDEADVAKVEYGSGLPCMWSPSPVVGSLIHEDVPPPTYNQAFFSGGVHHGRQMWLKHPLLQEHFSRLSSPDQGTLYAQVFDCLHSPPVRCLIQNPLALPFYSVYLNAVRRIRKRSYIRWLRGLQLGVAVVNLPHFVKSYTPRVIEGMAAGRPVLSWEIPNRPRNKALFQDGQEILLFNTPDQLAAHIQRLQSDALFAQQITENARRRIRKFHTTDKRVQQILKWIQTGKKPIYQ
ncbi:glycosyltransferase [Moorena producens JHB]|uniref:Glycosyltransferase n=1 Tax=Moorena producens (strain JHB) TaxID=1454205 RepID=A0A1D9FY49_MOOP1|nr:glycosyltransferase [Moorena producens]AOY80306.2 glycosyltransferase [Moorena producens JHB]